MRYNEYNPELSRNIAARLGLVVGGHWIISFLLVVLSFPSLLCDLGYLIGLLSIMQVGRSIRMVGTDIMPMSWGRRLWMALMSFMGGVLLTTLAQFVYFAYFDKGRFFGSMLEAMTDTALIDALKASGNNAMLDQMTQMTDILQSMTEMGPRLVTMNFFTTNIFLAIIFSFIASLFRGKAPK